MKIYLFILSTLLITTCAKRVSVQPDSSGNPPQSRNSEASLEIQSENMPENTIQTIFGVIWRKDTDSFSVKAIVHEKKPDLTSIAVFKSSRRILTIWKRGQQVWVYIPREKRVYIGHSTTPIVLFPNWPELTVDAWLDLLWGKGKSIAVLGKKHYQFADKQGGSLTWIQKKQKQKDSVPTMVFVPTYPAETQETQLEHLTTSKDRGT